ncbi:hypothetical protein ABZ341_27620 [Streptomyces sp. NPDC006173]|uniref:hypothetical protein n=1 Tax=Streptomyces sp. NPDC006173 TaxID=3155349 RepID=UPI0033FE2305
MDLPVRTRPGRHPTGHRSGTLLRGDIPETGGRARTGRRAGTGAGPSPGTSTSTAVSRSLAGGHGTGFVRDTGLFGLFGLFGDARLLHLPGLARGSW